MFFSFEHFSFHHRISGQCFNPRCSSENLFYSSTDQTFLSMSGGHWSLRWTCGTTTLHIQHYFSCNKDERKCSTLFLRSLWSLKRQFVCNICLDALTAISADRLLALSLGLRYRHVVALRRVRVVIICIWLIGSSAGIIRLWRVDISLHEVTVIVTISPVISFFCYTRIHPRLRHQQAQVQNHFRQRQVNDGRIPLNIARYKKIVSSILWVKVALLGSFVPFVEVAVLDANRSKVQGPWLATITLVYFNSSLNPILYCWKIKEIKESVKDTIKNLSCF